MSSSRKDATLYKESWKKIVKSNLTTLYGTLNEGIFAPTFEKHYKTFVMKEGEGFKGTMAGNINPKIKVFIDKAGKVFLIQGGKNKI